MSSQYVEVCQSDAADTCEMVPAAELVQSAHWLDMEGAAEIISAVALLWATAWVVRSVKKLMVRDL